MPESDIVTVTAFQTTDNNLWHDQDTARTHQERLDKSSAINEWVCKYVGSTEVIDRSELEELLEENLSDLLSLLGIKDSRY